MTEPRTTYVGSADQLEAILTILRAFETIPDEAEYYVAAPVPVRYSGSDGEPPVGYLDNDGTGWFYRATV